MQFSNKELEEVVNKAYKNAYFYSNICDIDSLNAFRDLPIICDRDIKDQTILLMADKINEAYCYFGTDIINRYMSNEEVNDLCKYWQLRLKDSKRVLCLLDEQSAPYLSIFNKLNLFVYPCASFNSCQQVSEIIGKYNIDTLIGTSNNMLILSQYIINNHLRLSLQHSFILCEHYNEDLVLRVNRYLGLQSKVIKYLPELFIEIGEINSMVIINKNIYPEIVEINGDKVLPLGQYGELVITLLNNNVQPLIRFSTNQKTRLIFENSLDKISINLLDKTAQLEAFLFMLEQVIDYNIDNSKEPSITLVTLGELSFSKEKIEDEIRKILEDQYYRVNIKQVNDYIL